MRVYMQTYALLGSTGVKAETKARREARDASVWTPERLRLLGRGDDRVVAIVLGLTEKAVAQKRWKLGIPAHRRHRPLVNQDGYVSVMLRPDDPLISMARRDQYVMLHRLVMARQLGRPLEADEFVHHRNGVRDDNRIENLELWTRSHPDGQRVEDVLLWATKLVARYGQHESPANGRFFWGGMAS